MTDLQKVELKNGQEMNYLKGTDGRHVFFKEAMFMSRFTFFLIIFMLIFSILANIYLGSLITDSGNRILSALKVIYAENYALIQGEGQNTLTPTNPPP